MRNFIKNTLTFIFTLLTLIVLLEIVSSKIVLYSSNFKIKDDPLYIVLGHSHSECAFNDSIITNFRNLSKAGEAYFYTYLKAKMIFEQNPKISTAFIEFSNNNIDKVMDKVIWGEKYMPHKFTQFSPFMNIEEKILLLRKNYKSFSNAFSISLKNRIGQIFNREFDYTYQIGGYLHLVSNYNPDGIDKKRREPNQNSKISESNINYLLKIIELCNKHLIRVVLVRSPLHEKYSGYQNESTYQLILENQLKGIEFLDFSKFPLRNSEYGDLEHLNYKGAKIFSTWFEQMLNQGLLDEKNKQIIINNEIGKIKAKR